MKLETENNKILFVGLIRRYGYPEYVIVARRWHLPSVETLNLLKERFGNGIIFRRGEVNWSSRLCDITPLDYFLWSILKERVYGNYVKLKIEQNVYNYVIENSGKSIVEYRRCRWIIF